MSYCQIRGSVPRRSSDSRKKCHRSKQFCVVFWEQQGLQTFGHRIQITRPTTSQPAFDRHFAQLVEEYGSVHAINLLGSKENEASLTSAYDRHLKIARGAIGEELYITHFDFHNAVRVGGHDSVIRDLRFLYPSISNSLLSTSY